MAENQNDAVVIQIMAGGPLIVKGLGNWKNSKGDDLPVKESIALCRCGESSNKPYCDGTHSVIGFSGKRKIDRPLTKEKAYQGEKLTIYDNRTICCHAAECVKNLSSVFRMNDRPWIDADAAAVEAIIEVVNKCPSGALSYSINDEHYRDQEREFSIHIDKNGPYNVMGGIQLEISEEMQPPSREHYSLCRCGASKNKPYCDGSHADSNFIDDDN